MSAILALLLVAAALLVVGGPARAADPPIFDPIDCSTPTTFLAQGLSDGTGPTQLNAETYTLSGAVFQPLGAPWAGGRYNAIAFNQADSFIYGVAEWNGDAQQYSLLRVGANGAVQDLGKIEGMPTDARFINNGAFFDGAYYVSSFDGPSGEQIFRVDIDTLIATPITLSQSWTNADFTQIGNFLWGAAENRIGRLNPITGQVDYFAVPAVPAIDMNAGAVFTFGNGNLGVNSSSNGAVTQFRIDNPDSATPTFTVISRAPGPASSRNDGTACLPAVNSSDLAVTKSGPITVGVGSTISWTITVTNNGPIISSGYTLQDQLPANVTNVQAAEASCTVVALSLTCVGAVLAVGASQTFHVTASAPQPLGRSSTPSTSSATKLTRWLRTTTRTGPSTCQTHRACRWSRPRMGQR